MHDDAGYIVMEYVGGKSLKNILKDRMTANGGRYDPIPVDQAIAYMLEILPAFQYLHDIGLLYCDFKPDNVIQAGDAVKLIDLGGVRRADDLESAIYGTVGYQAPEVPEVGPSVVERHLHDRPHARVARDGVPRLHVDVRRQPAADRATSRCSSATTRCTGCCSRPARRDPDDRFQSADELREQLLGVLREVVALDRRGDRPAAHSTASALFEAPVVESDTLAWRNLPALRVDETDPQAAWLDGGERDRARGAARRAAAGRARARPSRCGWPRRTPRSRPSRHDVAAARGLARSSPTDPWEWRAVWLSGLAALAAGDPAQAQAAFNAVYGQVPGELAPKLALALACELGDQPDVAEALYLTCLRTDANYTAPAAFGLARIRAAAAVGRAGRADRGDRRARPGAARPAGRSSPPGGSGPSCWCATAAGSTPTRRRSTACSGVSLDPRELARLRIDVLQRRARRGDDDGAAAGRARRRRPGGAGLAARRAGDAPTASWPG